MKKKIVILQNSFNIIGGIETCIENFCKTFYKDYDITIATGEIDNNRALALCEYADIVCEPEDIECDVLLITTIWVNNNFFDRIKYKKVLCMAHCDYAAMNKILPQKLKVNKIPDAQYIAVSEAGKTGLMSEYGIDSIVIPNLLLKPTEGQKLLRLVSATRLTVEKGYGRMKKLCDMLEDNNIPYLWDVYTNGIQQDYKGMTTRKQEPNISRKFCNYDYVVQLSDTESFCYTMYEALQNKTPLLITPFPIALKEIKDGENGYILPFDMDIDSEFIQKMYNNIPKNVKYTQTGVKAKWKNILD